MNLALWDTSLLSHAVPTGRHSALYCHAVMVDGSVATAAPALAELLYGLARRSDQRFRSAEAWFAHEVVGGRLVVLPFGADEASLAARLRAAHPLPDRRPRAGRSKPDDRVAWVADISIAVCAWLDGRGVLTENVSDFVRLAGAFPEEPLDVLRP